MADETPKGTISEEERKEHGIPDNITNWGDMVKSFKDTRADHTRLTQDKARIESEYAEAQDQYLSKLDTKVAEVPAAAAPTNEGAAMQQYRQMYEVDPAQANVWLQQQSHQAMLDQMGQQEQARRNADIERAKISNQRALENQRNDVIKNNGLTSQEFIEMEGEIKTELNRIPMDAPLAGDEMQGIVDKIKGRQSRERQGQEVEAKVEADSRETVTTEAGSTLPNTGSVVPDGNTSLEDHKKFVEAQLAGVSMEDFAKLQ
jgi:hypothetical protein